MENKNKNNTNKYLPIAIIKKQKNKKILKQWKTKNKNNTKYLPIAIRKQQKNKNSINN